MCCDLLFFVTNTSKCLLLYLLLVSFVNYLFLCIVIIYFYLYPIDTVITNYILFPVVIISFRYYYRKYSFNLSFNEFTYVLKNLLRIILS